MQIKAGGAPPEYTLNTSVVIVLFGHSKGARKVSVKCIKGTPAVRSPLPVPNKPYGFCGR